MEAYNFRNVQLIILILATAFHREALAANHVVGGSEGWDDSADFDSWVSAQTFKVGDQLEFKYSALHSVAELPSESAYKSCSIGSSLNSLNGGSNTIKLDKTGTRYFVCGTAGHCEQGMKVKITIVAAEASSSTTTTTSTPAAAHSTSVASPKIQFIGFFTLIGSLMLSLVRFMV